MSFRHLKIGDTVKRNLSGVIMDMIVTDVQEDVILCGGTYGWTFDRDSGWEEDHDIGWGVSFGRTGSHLIKD